MTKNAPQRPIQMALGESIPTPGEDGKVLVTQFRAPPVRSPPRALNLRLDSSLLVMASDSMEKDRPSYLNISIQSRPLLF